MKVCALLTAMSKVPATKEKESTGPVVTGMSAEDKARLAELEADAACSYATLVGLTATRSLVFFQSACVAPSLYKDHAPSVGTVSATWIHRDPTTGKK